MTFYVGIEYHTAFFRFFIMLMVQTESWYEMLIGEYRM